VTIRELRNQGGAVVNRVAAGERLIVTRSGTPVAELRPIRSPTISSTALLERWRRLPKLDYDKLRDDLDAIIESGV
ncbi:MAG TPA: type II toxin-antitoxin system prevent-host-death family antitoxin, partial [Methylomirabilota bacterium]|nr:type II toxin-antitoxin system prevent-host-death family antitoxin [Methylomirabilota bacterium]